VTERAVALALAVLLFVGSACAGRTYLWCVAMDRAMSACCTAGDDDELAPGVDGHPGISHPCCERHRTGDLAKAQVPPSPLEVPPPLAILAPALPPAAPPVRPARRVQVSRPAPRLDRPIRAGPGAALAAAVRLQVFRC
jgi:hypothetical protein